MLGSFEVVLIYRHKNHVSKPYRYARKETLSLISAEIIIEFQNLIGMLGRGNFK